ncbi:MAG TPA: FliM/FliN family flagellar motor switch protein [Acidocella sp.]|nr:FliM/FliN family flagellar motor switch protein [Acidocella sp.]
MLEEMQDVEVLDLLDSMRAPQLRSLLMENLSDRFMRQIAFALFQRMRHSVQLLSCINGVTSHESAMSSLPDVMLAGIAELTPLRGRMLVAIDGDLIGAVVDAMCGATTAHPFERDELSALETRIGKQMIDLTLSTISETLSGLMQLNLTPIAYENATGMIAIADGQDWMIAVTGIFETALGTGTIKLIAPYAGFEPLEAKVNSQSGLLGGRGADTGWVTAIENLSENTPVELRLELARAAVPLAVFEAMQPGQILPFFLSPEAIAVSGGIDLFRAEYGQNDGYICCRVIADGLIEGDLMMADQKTADQKEQPGAAAARSAAMVAERNVPENERVELERLQSQPRGLPAITSKNVLDRVQVSLTVELGRTHITVKDLRQLRHGQIVTLDQTVGEPLTIFANGQKLAYGEVVAVANDRYGVRVTALAEDADAAGESAA